MNSTTNGRFDIGQLRQAAEGQWIDRILPQYFDRESLDGRPGPCPKCGGTDRFRMIDAKAGAVYCNQCFSEGNGSGFDAIMWRRNCNLTEAVAAVADVLGFAGGAASGRIQEDIIAKVARIKRMPLASYLAFGAHEAKRGTQVVARVPMYDEHRQQCSEFDMADCNDAFRKGLSAKGKPVGLFVAEWPEPGDTVVITEGVKDAAAVHSLGYKAIGLPTCKLQDKSTRVFSRVHVILVPDLDKTGFESAPVNAAKIYGTAASVKIVRLPGEMKDTGGDGVREVLAKRDGAALVRQAIADAVTWEPPVTAGVISGGWVKGQADNISTTTAWGGDHVPIAADIGAITQHATPIYQIDDPHRLASMFRVRHSVGELCSYRRCNEIWYRFTGKKYVIVADEELRAELTSFVQSEFDRDAAVQLAAWNAGHKESERMPTAKSVRKNLITDILAHLTAQTIIPGDTLQPSWLGAKPDGFDSRCIVPFSNGILNLQRLVSGENDYLIPSTPRYFSTNVLPYAFDEHAPEPKEWLKFLSDLWPSDPDSVRCLQEWFGLFLVSDTRHQKILLMVGPRRSGKGTIGRIIRALIGDTNVAGPTLASLGTNFGLWPLIGRQVAIVADARLSKQTDVAVVAERLLQISGEDGVTIDRKNLSPLHITLSTRFVLMTNELPRLTDASSAMAGRFVILKMVNSFFGQEDQELTERLLQELPGIMLWAIEGWTRLTQQKRFTIPESSLDLITQLEDSTSPVGAFVRECCDVRSDLEIDKDELFNSWRDWCTGEGQAHPGTAATFAVQLRAAVATVGTKRAKVAGARFNRFTGIGLKTFD